MIRLKLPTKKPAPTPVVTKTKVVPSMPKQGGPRAPLPTLWHRGLAGVEFSRRPGPGERHLDNICKQNGWTWGITSTTLAGDEDHTVRVDVLIGTVISGFAESLGGQAANNGAQSWNEIDEAMAAIARSLEGE
jgi:hypothetical protein